MTNRDQGDRDGGFSGGTLDRPELRALIEDVEAGLVDVIVVYKIGGLSRSLMDFAKLVGVFDRHGVTFVSVTRAFNTTSMGRLTLNILLSFAQFEREVIGERIRGKFAASHAGCRCRITPEPPFVRVNKPLHWIIYGHALHQIHMCSRGDHGVGLLWALDVRFEKRVSGIQTNP